MPIPWKSATPKVVNGISGAQVARPGHAFAAPALPSRLSFTRTAFSLAMARTSAQSGFPRAAMTSLVQVMNGLVKDHVDDGNPIDRSRRVRSRT